MPGTSACAAYQASRLLIMSRLLTRGAFVKYSVSTKNAIDCYYGYMAKTSLTDQIRDHARRQYIEGARRRGEAVVRIVAGDVHKALGLANRVPVVCNALSSKSFLQDNKIALESRVGPPSL